MAGFSIKKKLFGKEAEIVLYDAERSIGEAVAESAYQEALRLHKIFNFYDPKSELSQLNSKRKLAASKEMVEVLKLALKFAKETGGEYDVSLGRTFLARKKGEAEPEQTCSYKDITIKGNTVSLDDPQVLVDLGSIAKGYIADKMARQLQREGAKSGLIDARGDIVVFGAKAQRIIVQNPRVKEEGVATITLKSAAVATSGDYNQFVGDFDHSHIVGKKDLISVTVIAPTLMEADVFASAVFLVEPKKRAALLSKHGHPTLVIDKDLKISFHNGFENYLAKG